MKKREDFAVNLRKKKKDSIIKEKRKRFMRGISSQNQPPVAAIYRCCPLFTDEKGKGEIQTVQNIVSQHIPGIVLRCDAHQTPEELIVQVDKIVSELVNPETKLQSTEQLALVAAVRMHLDTLAGLQDPRARSIFQVTQIQRFIQAALAVATQQLRTCSEKEPQHQIAYCLGCEIAWILCNLACFDGFVAQQFVQPQLESPGIWSEQPTIYFEFAQKMLCEGDESQKELMLWLLSNCIPDSASLGKMLIEKLGYLDILFKISDQEKLKKEVLQSLLWNLNQLAKHRLIAGKDAVATARICTASLNISNLEIQY